MPPEPADRPEIEDIFDEVRIGDARGPPAGAGWWRVPGRNGRPAGHLDVRVDARPHRVTHEEAVSLSVYSPESVDGQIACKLRAMRRGAAYEALRAMSIARHLSGIRIPEHPEEYVVQAAAFVRGLQDILHETGTITHLLMPSGMYLMYSRSIDVLDRTPAWHDHIRRNISLSRLGNVRIIRSVHAETIMPNTAYAVNAACALHFQGPVSYDVGRDITGAWTSVETHEQYQFLLLSADNARIAPGMPYDARPGFGIEVEDVWAGVPG